MSITPVCRVSATGLRNWFRSVRLTIVVGLLLLSLVNSGPAQSDSTGRALSPWTGPVPREAALTRLDAGTSSLAEHHDTVVLVHFFATWCETCGPELEALERLRRDIGARGLTIHAISVAEPEVRLRRYFAARPVGFPIFTDTDRRNAKAWGVVTLPTTFVLGRNAMPLFQAAHDVDWDSADVRRKLDEALTARPPQN